MGGPPGPLPGLWNFTEVPHQGNIQFEDIALRSVESTGQIKLVLYKLYTYRNFVLMIQFEWSVLGGLTLQSGRE